MRQFHISLSESESSKQRDLAFTIICALAGACVLFIGRLLKYKIKMQEYQDCFLKNNASSKNIGHLQKLSISECSSTFICIISLILYAVNFFINQSMMPVKKQYSTSIPLTKQKNATLLPASHRCPEFLEPRLAYPSRNQRPCHNASKIHHSLDVAICAEAKRLSQVSYCKSSKNVAPYRLSICSLLKSG
jgi:hypothetical protein